jgi:hypothetical protein
VLATLLAASVFVAAGSTTIEVPDSGHIVRVGDFRPKQRLGETQFPGGVAPTRRNAIKAYGPLDPPGPSGCSRKWKKLGVRMVNADYDGGAPCAPWTAIQTLVITGRQWKTERGLKIGDSLDRVRELYPELIRFKELLGEDIKAYRYEWALVLEPSPAGGPPNLLDRLSANIRARKVVSLTVSPYGAGD